MPTNSPIPRLVRIEATTITAVPLTRPRVRRPAGSVLRVVRWLLADVHASLAIALGVPVALVEAAHGFAGSAPVLAVTAGYFTLQVALALIVGGAARGARGLARFLLAVGFVGALALVEPRTEGTLPVLYVPVIVLAAATSAWTGITVALAAAVVSRLILAIQVSPTAAIEQSFLPILVVSFLAIGTRRVVASLERSVERFRRIVATERRRARRMRAIEQVGRVLAQDGPSPAVLATIMDVLVRTFGYRYPSVYLWQDDRLRLGAQRGYEHPILEFDLEVGIIGRVARTREAVFAPDVTRVPEYEEADSDVVSEISVPLQADGELLGVLNVESTAAEPLDRDDFASMLLIGDRLSASIALGRERQKLAERAALLGRLAAAFRDLAGTLDPAELHHVIARTSTSVIASDVGVLTLRAPGATDYRVAGAHGTDRAIGMQVEPGEGATGRAIAEKAPVLDSRFERQNFSRLGRQVVDDDEVAIMAVPILRQDDVVGAITFVRHLPSSGFTDQEREVAGLLATQAALAIANADLHADTAEQAIRDPLTRLHNRRLLDDALARMSAARARQRPDERRTIAAILFDLDHFGDFNNRHGHLAGDAVLRAFADLLAGRFRASDLVARYGGEEFIVILDGASREDAVRAAEEIRLAFRATEIGGPGGAALRATVSAGCASLDPSVADLGAMIEVADVGLAMAKAGGRNQVVAA